MLVTGLKLTSSLASRTQLLYLLLDLSSNVIEIEFVFFFFLCTTRSILWMDDFKLTCSFLWMDDFMLFATFWSRILLLIFYTFCSDGLNHALYGLQRFEWLWRVLYEGLDRALFHLQIIIDGTLRPLYWYFKLILDWLHYVWLRRFDGR